MPTPSPLFARWQWAACAALALLAPATAAPGDPRPNILWILAEDMCPDLGCYGNALVKSPNIDALAARGVRFTNAFTVTSVCSTSRSALMTGCYPIAIGAHQHRTWTAQKKPLPDGVRLLTDRLRAAGYFTVNLTAPDSAAGDRYKAGAGIGTGKTDFNFVAARPYDGRDWRERAPGQPFFATITLEESHKGWGWKAAGALPASEKVDRAAIALAPFYPEHPHVREEIGAYFDAIHLMDKSVGAVLARLAADGLADRTIVVFMGDNGEPLLRSKGYLYDGGVHVPLVVAWPDRRRAGAVDDRLVSGVDLPAAILGFAGIKPDGVFHGVDFLDPATPPRGHVFGSRDRIDYSVDRMRSVRTKRWKYIRNYLPFTPYMEPNEYKEANYPTWNVVKQLARENKLAPAAALFAAPAKPIEELYDLANDPHELRNQALDPAHRDTLRALRALVDGWVRDTRDAGAIMEDPVENFRGFFRRLPEDPPPAAARRPDR